MHMEGQTYVSKSNILHVTCQYLLDNFPLTVEYRNDSFIQTRPVCSYFDDNAEIYATEGYVSS